MTWASIAIGVGSAAIGAMATPRGGSQTNTMISQSDPYGPAVGSLQAGLGMAGPAYNRAMALPGPRDLGLMGPAADIFRNEFSRPYSVSEPALRQMAGIDAQFEQLGRYGSGMHQGAIGEAGLSDFDRFERQRMQLAGQAPGLEAAPYQLYGARVGAPYEAAQRYSDIARAAATAGQRNIDTSSQPLYTNPLTGALGGAMTGLGLYNQFGQPNIFGGGGGYGYVPGQFGSLGAGFGGYTAGGMPLMASGAGGKAAGSAIGAAPMTI